MLSYAGGTKRITVGGTTTLSPSITGTLSGVVTWYWDDGLLERVAPHQSPYRSLTFRALERCTVGTTITAQWDTFDYSGQIYPTSHSDSWTIYIDPLDPTSISLNYTSASLEVGETKQLSASVSPSGASQSVTWSVVSGSSVASVSSSGLVTAKSAGTATIRATSSEKSSVYKDCAVTVTEATPPTSISLNYTSISLTEGETKQLSASVYPSGASQSVTWSVVSGSSFASVSSSGLITAKSPGTATIRATSSANSSIYKNCTVTVTETVLEPGTLSGNTLTIGNNATSSAHEVPYGNYYHYSTTQLLYTPTEIGKSGTINSIAFKVASSTSFTTSDVKIYLGHKSGKFSSTSNYVSSANLTLVYSGTPTIGQATGWEALTFNQGTFTYNGTDNLVVVVSKKADSYTDQLKYYCYSGSGYALYRQNDYTQDYANVSNTSYSYTALSNRPSVKFTFVPTPTSISLNYTSISLTEGETKQLSASVYPSGASQSVTWSVVSGSNVASVSSSGLVTANAVGTATVRATSKVDSSVFTDCIVTVEEATLSEGAWFSVTSLEGIELHCQVTSVIDKTCMVGGGDYSTWEPTAVENKTISGTLTIPDQTQNGYKVTAIGDGAFVLCEYLTAINLPASITSIGNDAFNGCWGLSSITIPNNVTSIGNKAFYCCDALLTVELSKNLIIIGRNAFTDCYNLTYITIPNTVTEIGEGAFFGCVGLTDITCLISNPFAISDHVFQYYDYDNGSQEYPLSATLHVPAGTKALYEATAGWNQLTIVEMEEGGNNDETTVKIDGIYYELSDGQSFNDAIGMELLPADENVAIVVADPHYNYYGDIVIPSSINYESTTYSVVGIAEGAFAEYKEMHQRYIRSVVIPNSVLIIGEEAFVESTTLQRVEIPNSVICICDDAFGDCESLREIISYIEAPFGITSKVFRNIASDAILYVPYGTKSLYESTSGWNQLNIVEMTPNDPTVFTAECANGVVMTFKITDEDSKMCQIGTGISTAISISYSGSVVLPKLVNGYTVTSIAANAFANCTNIWDVYIPNTIKAIGEKAFYGCSNLSSVDSYIEEPFDIPSNVFENTASNKSLDAIYGTKEMYFAAQGWNVFNSIHANMVIIDGIHYFVNGADPGKLDPYTAWVEEPIWDTYEGNIVIPETLVIGNESFTVEGIDGAVFDDCNITSVSFPQTVTCIESSFSGCTQLRTVISYIPNPENVDVSSHIFEDVPEDAILYVPEGTKALYENTAGWNRLNIVEMEPNPEETEDTDISQMENAIYMTPSEAVLGNDAKLTIKLKNAAPITTYAFDLVLPEGLTIEANSSGKYNDKIELSTRHVDHSPLPSKLQDDTYRIVVASLGTEELTGNDGIILTITIHVADDMSDGDYPIFIKNPLLVAPNGSKPTINEVKTHITIKDYLKGDVDGDGSIDPADAVLIINHYLKKPLYRFIEKAAYVDDDDVIDPADAVIILNYYLKKIPSLSPSNNTNEIEPQ